MIHTIGDSHALFSFIDIEYVICHTIGPVTMESIGKIRPGKSSSEYLDMIVSDYNIEINDIIILCFGEIDVRCTIKPKIDNGESIEEIINTLTSNYFKTIKNSAHKNFWILSITPPSHFHEVNHRYPFLGTDEERSFYTKKMNKCIKEKCEESDIPLLDVYDYYCDDSGMLKKELSDNNVHIGHTNFVELSIEKLKNEK